MASDCSVPQPAVLCMSGRSPGLVWAVRNPLLRPQRGVHCYVNQNSWLQDAYLCLEGHVWATECPFLLSALSLFCLSSVVVSQVIHPSAETWEQCFSALNYPGWCTVAATEVQLHLPALATVTALSAQTIALRLFLLRCIIMGKVKKEM